MNSGDFTVTLLLFFSLITTTTVSGRVIRLSPNHLNSLNNDSFCESWKLSIELNNAGHWSVIPEKCVDFVEGYMLGDRYRSDSEVVAEFALEYAKNVNVVGDGKDCWVFDVDETLLSHLPYYVKNGFGSVTDENSFNEWMNLAEAPALPASLRLYTELQRLGFTIFLLTGRSEFQRKLTDKNLEYSGFTNYKKLLLRGDSDLDKPATLYKSEKRQELINKGYKIHGSSGDQWSDLFGFATAKRSFKLPNPLYHIA